ncbi:hypothetical protein C0Q70_15978 [Pomacea canaliculata]|uniref:Uncharacterized protein n=1 Tax=Pomacea canaliculata TaxID=400727 RepID=A0A2T7NNK1_POMCA|nr:hypothetical protein C0Q70_15978 [Pomacea canaliculata]
MDENHEKILRNRHTSALSAIHRPAFLCLAGCYVATCVPEFIACARRSRTTSTFEMCKLEHRTCAMRCWELANDDAAK